MDFFTPTHTASLIDVEGHILDALNDLEAIAEATGHGPDALLVAALFAARDRVAAIFAALAEAPAS